MSLKFWSARLTDLQYTAMHAPMQIMQANNALATLTPMATASE